MKQASIQAHSVALALELGYSTSKFAYLPKKVPHVFLNLLDEPGEIIVDCLGS